MPSQQRSAAEHCQSARATASWLTSLPPSSPNTDSTNPSATPACNCTKINYKKRLRARAGGRAPRARVAQPSWLWANGHLACCSEPYGDQSRGGLANPSTELPCNFGERPNVEIYIMSLLASFMNLAGPDLIVILLIVLVLFGAKKLPELARGMGQAVREFQKAKDEFSDELNKAGKTEEKTVHPAQANVPRIEPGNHGATQPDPNQTVPPGHRPDRL